jgi:CheY-like chemotaxis protein
MVTKDLLLVEDSEDDAFFFERTFQESRNSFALHHVQNGAEAIDFLKKAETSNSLPKIVFLDLKMPVLNGFEVLTWLQKQKFAKDLPVVVLSGSSHEADKTKASDLGARDYLVKPLTVENLNRLLKQMVPGASGKTKGAS